MSKPNGNNRLTRDLLRLRDDQITPAEAKAAEVDPQYHLSIDFSGPGFSANLKIRGERWAAEKLLDDFNSSLRNM